MSNFHGIYTSRNKTVHPKEITGPRSHTHKQGYRRLIDFQIMFQYNAEVSHDEDTYN